MTHVMSKDIKNLSINNERQASHLGDLNTLFESLILAQDERWRRA